MLAIIERFEGDFALLEIKGGSQTIKILRGDIPATAREGDLLLCREGEWLIDFEATARRKKEVEELAAELWKD